MADDITERLKLFIDRARSLNRELPNNKIKAEVYVLEFQNWVTQFLDYAFTNFFTDEGKNGSFMRPMYQEEWASYLTRLEKKIRISQMSKTFQSFCRACFDVIRNNDYAVALIYPKAKHEQPHTLRAGNKLSGESARDVSNIVSNHADGSTYIGGNAMRIGPNVSNIQITDSSLNGHYIKDLHISRIENNNIIFILNSGEEVNLPFTVWAGQCINICEDIYSFLNK